MNSNLIKDLRDGTITEQQFELIHNFLVCDKLRDKAEKAMKTYYNNLVNKQIKDGVPLDDITNYINAYMPECPAKFLLIRKIQMLNN